MSLPFAFVASFTNRMGRTWFPPAALLWLARRRMYRSWLSRAARLAAIVVFVGSGVQLLLQGESVGHVIHRALMSLTWSAGLLAALSASQPWADADRREGIVELLAVRGVATAELSRAYLVVGLWQIGTLVALPALALWLILLVGSCGSSSGVFVGPGIVAYAAIVAVVLGGAARWVAAWVPSRPKIAFLMLVVLPSLINWGGVPLPSLPAAFSTVGHFLTATAAGAS